MRGERLQTQVERRGPFQLLQLSLICGLSSTPTVFRYENVSMFLTAFCTSCTRRVVRVPRAGDLRLRCALPPSTGNSKQKSRPRYVSPASA